MNFRKERLENLITELLGKEIIKRVDLPDVLITIIKTDITDDLETARVYFSIFPDSKERETVNEIKKMTHEFQYFLMKKLKMKRAPTLVFK